MAHLRAGSIIEGPLEDEDVAPVPPPKTTTAPAKRVKSWDEIAVDPVFVTLSPEDKEAVRVDYFRKMILPRVSRGEEESAWEQFTVQTVKPSRGVLGDIGASLASGIAVDIPEMAGRALRTLDPPGGIDVARRVGTSLVEGAERIQATRPFAQPSVESQESLVRRAITGGVRSAPVSLAAGLPGAVAGGVLSGPVGAITGFAAGGGTVFGLAEYDRFREEAERSGIAPGIAGHQAVKAAFLEGGLEAASNVLAALTLGVGQIARQPLKSTVRAMIRPTVKGAVKRTALALPFEVGTEVAQEAGGAKLRQDVGMPTISPRQAATEAVGPAVVMTLLFGAGAHGLNLSESRRIGRTLSSATARPDDRTAAAQRIAGSIAQHDPEMAQTWLTGAAADIAAGRPIALDADLSALPPRPPTPSGVGAAFEAAGLGPAAVGIIHAAGDLSSTPSLIRLRYQLLKAEQGASDEVKADLMNARAVLDVTLKTERETAPVRDALGRARDLLGEAEINEAFFTRRGAFPAATETPSTAMGPLVVPGAPPAAGGMGPVAVPPGLLTGKAPPAREAPVATPPRTGKLQQAKAIALPKPAAPPLGAVVPARGVPTGKAPPDLVELPAPLPPPGTVRSLMDLVRQAGGIRSDIEGQRGEADFFQLKEGVGLVNNQTGKPWDRLRERAVEEGFVPEDMTLAEFQQAVRDDVTDRKQGGSGVYLDPRTVQDEAQRRFKEAEAAILPDEVPVGDLKLDVGDAFTINRKPYVVDGRNKDGDLVIKGPENETLVVDDTFGRIPEPDAGSITREARRPAPPPDRTARPSERDVEPEPSPPVVPAAPKVETPAMQPVETRTPLAGTKRPPAETIRQESETAVPQSKTAADRSLELGEWVRGRFATPDLRAHGFTLDELTRKANLTFGGTQAEGKYTVKDMMDAMEVGINRHLADQLTLNPRTMTAERMKEAIVDLRMGLMDRLPSQGSRRTAEQDEFQQFSTPPDLALVMNWAAGLRKGDIVLEPSAGLGGLAVFAKNAGAKVIVNELSPRRAAILEQMGFDRVFTENAEQLNNILPKDVKPTVVVMNPPFSATAGRVEGERSSRNAQVHIEQALKRLEPGGRLVALVGDGIEGFAGPTALWNELGQKYRFLASIGISGKGYKKWGTTFNNRILVYDKMAPTGTPPVTARVDNVRDAIDLLRGVRDARQDLSPTSLLPEQAPIEPRGEVVVEAGRRPAEVPGVEPSPRPEPDAVGVGGRGDRTADEGRNRPALERGADVGARPEAAGGVELPPRGAGRADAGREGIEGEQGAEGSSVVAPGRPRPEDALRPELGERVPADLPVQPRVAPLENTPEPTAHDAVYERYTPQRLNIEGAQPHPSELVQSAAMAATDPPAPRYTPNLPAHLIATGKLSDAQLEAIMYAGQAHEKILPNGERKGFFVGDGTGVGKGREISGIIMDNMRRGRKKAVWMSVTGKLINDATRDWTAIGGDKSDLFDLSKTKLSGSVHGSKGILFTTYSTLGSGMTADAGGNLKLKEGKPKSRLDQIVSWLGADFDGVVVFDETHKLANAISTKGKRGATGASRAGLAGVELQKRLPKARIVYVSATGATRVESLAYAERLGLWGEGTPFPTKQDFIGAINEGGLAAMEIVARDLKSAGSYIARSLSFRGVTYGQLEHELTPEQTTIYDTLARAWQTVLGRVNEAMESNGSKQNGAARSAALSKFWGSHQRFFNQVLTSMQMPSVLRDLRAKLDEGHAAVVQLVNTNEAIQERQISERQEEEEGLENLDLTPRQNLMQYIKNSFPTQQYERYTDEDGNEKSRPVVDSRGNPVENAEAVQMRDALLDELGAIKVPDGPLEMLFNEFGPDRVAEITGRGRRVVQVQGPDGGTKTEIQKRSPSIAAADVQHFMDDRKQILVFSDAGGTGRSFHADRGAKNQRRRFHYLVQPGWRADNAVQGFGRTHRTNQVAAPHCVLATTNLKGQKRFMSSIARRLDQLGALTKGQRQTGSQGLFTAKDNLEGPYARGAVQKFFADLLGGEVKGKTFAELTERMGLTGLLDQNGRLNETKLPEVPQFLNRLLSLESAEQNRIFDEFYGRMERAIDAAAEQGMLDVGLENFKADKLAVTKERVVFTHPETGAKTHLVDFEAQHKTKKLTFASATKSKEYRGLYRNIRSGKVWAASGGLTRTKANGDVVTVVRLRSPAVERWQTVDESDLTPEKWMRLSDDAAPAAWAAAVEAEPAFRKETVHILSGSLLPIWDRLPRGQNRVLRLVTDDQKRYVGREIKEDALGGTMERLGLGVETPDLTPEQMIERVLEDGASLELANGWTITRRTVVGEPRIEIEGDLYAARDELHRAGVIQERVGYATRFFIPTGENAPDVLSRVTKYRPIIRVQGGKRERGMVREEGAAYGTREPAPIFFSQLRKVVEAKMPNAAPATVVKAMLAAPKHGVKAEELAWSGLDDFLAEKKAGKVTKQEVLDFLAQNEVQVREVERRETADDLTPAERGTPAMKRSVLEEGQSLFEPQPRYTQTDAPTPRTQAEARAQAEAELARLEAEFGGGDVPPAAGVARGPRRKARTLALGIVRSFRQGIVDLTGHQAPTIDDLAVLGQVFRNPKFETLRFFYFKGDRIIEQEGVSSRLPGTSAVFIGKWGEGIARLRQRMKDLGADGYMMLHNHPSGRPNPSADDLGITIRISRAVPGFKGHVIINSGRYAVIHKDGTARTAALPSPTTETLLVPARPHPLLGERIGAPVDVARLGKLTQRSDDYAVVLFRAGTIVRAIKEVPIAAFANAKAAGRMLSRSAKAFGAQDAFAYYRGPNGEAFLKTIRPVFEQGSLTDAIYDRPGAPLSSILETGGLHDMAPGQHFMGQALPDPIRVKEDPGGYAVDEIRRGRSPRQVVDRLFRLPFARSLDADGRWTLGVKLHRAVVEYATDWDTGGTHPAVDQFLKTVRTGLIDKYGLPEEYVTLRKRRERERNAISLEGIEAFRQIRELATSDEELTALNDILTNRDADPGVWASLSEPIRSLVTRYGQEMVDAKLLPATAFERHKGQYLHRTYKDFVASTPAIAHAFRKIKLIGKEFKGRGKDKMVPWEQVDAWTSGTKDGHRWELRGKTRDGKAWINRDWTKDERATMHGGEMEDAAYNVAMTFDLIAKDLSTGKMYQRIANDPLLAVPVKDPDTGEATPAPEGWVHFGNEKITKSATAKWGALADYYVHPDVARDLKLTEEYSRPTTWRWLLTQWKLNKALALDTPIPTPTGWTTMGAIRLGDYVFDECGQVCTVLEVKEIQINRPCYRVSFSDDTDIVADAEHLWFTLMRNYGAGVRTTAEILDTLTEASRGDHNHSVPVAAAFNLPPVDLPLPPYALGIWAGDGDSRSARISVGSGDADEVASHLRSSGVRCSKGTVDKRTGVRSFTIQRLSRRCPRDHSEKRMRADGKGCLDCQLEARRKNKERSPVTNARIATKMREIGLIGNKHIPAVYLRASEDQRRELLSGLMDSDGSVTARGTCIFATSIPTLRDGMVELLRSLGYKPTMSDSIPTCNGKPGKRSWRVHFQAYADQPVFRLARKVVRLKPRPAMRQRSQTRQIIAVTPVPSVPVRCIAVSSKSSLYLAGAGMVPTHNTARNPVVHTNNMVSNLFLGDMHDLSTADMVRGIQELRSGSRYYTEARADGVFGHNLIGAEIKPFYDPALATTAASGNPLVTAVALVKKGDRAMIDWYSKEDDVMRLALYIKLREQGKSREEATAEAVRQFVDYNISAPWILAARNSVVPFASYSYRVLPLILEAATTRPWKLLKYYALFTGLEYLAAGMTGTDPDEERKLLPERMQGRTWFGVPKQVRTPFGFQDISRWVPGGDVADIQGENRALPLPAPLNPGGPIDIAFSFFRNRDPFTGKEIRRDAIPVWRQAQDVSLWLYRQLGPNAPWVPDSYSWDKIVKASKGVTDELGRAYDVPSAVLSTVGVKTAPFDPELQRLRKIKEIGRQVFEARLVLRQAQRRLAKHDISQAQFATIRDEQMAIITRLSGTMAAANRTAESLRRPAEARP